MPAISYACFEAEVLSLYDPPLRRPATRAKIRTILREFGALGLKRASDITPVAVASWLAAHSERKPITNFSYLGAFRAACNYARKMHYLRVSPFECRSPSDWVRIDDSDDESEVPRHYSIDQIAAILVAADGDAALGSWAAGRLQALIYTYAFTGMRKNEALGLTLREIDLPGRVIRLKSTRRRTLKSKSSARPIGIAEPLAAVLARWLPRTGCAWVFPGLALRGPWTGGGPGNKALDQVRELSQRAGIEDVTILGFRHSIATHAARWGLGPLQLRDLLRHTNLATQEWYREEDVPNARAIARKISFKIGG